MVKLRPKERKFVKNKVEGYTGAESVRRAGYNVNGNRNAAVLAHNMANKPKIQEALAEMLEKHELTQNRLLAKNSELLDATDKDGNPQFEVQRRAMEAGYKLHQMPGFGREVQLHAHQHNVVLEDVFKDLDEGVIDG